MPNRIIKESIRTSKSVNSLSDFQFRLWLYLITYVDDFGRGSADPDIIKGFVFPKRKSVTEQQIQRTLDELATAGMIILYKVDGESFLYFPNWDKHQRIQTKRSKFPSPPEDNDASRYSTVSHGDPLPESESNPNPNPNYNPNPESKSESDAHGREGAFDLFWEAYPKKTGKQEARKAFKKVSVPVETLIDAIERQKTWSQWKRDNGQYIPNPSTWLNQGRWDDEDYTAGVTGRKKYTTKGSFIDDE